MMRGRNSWAHPWTSILYFDRAEPPLALKLRFRFCQCNHQLSPWSPEQNLQWLLTLPHAKLWRCPQLYSFTILKGYGNTRYSLLKKEGGKLLNINGEMKIEKKFNSTQRRKTNVWLKCTESLWVFRDSYLTLLTICNDYFGNIGLFPMFTNSLMPKTYIISLKISTLDPTGSFL